MFEKTKKRLCVSLFLLTAFLCFHTSWGHERSKSHYYLERDVEASVQEEKFKPSTFHLYTHGRPGQLKIEDKWMNKEQIADFLIEILPSEVNQLYIYGCEFARNQEGKEAVKYLENQLGMRISASDDITGVDGDWEMEIGTTYGTVSLTDFLSNLQSCSGLKGGMKPGDDFDGDGVCNDLDYDDDNDGIVDIYEINGSACTSSSNTAAVSRGMYNGSAAMLNNSQLTSISDANLSTQLATSYTGLPSINRMFFSYESMTVNEIRIYNYINGHINDQNWPHIESINRIELKNGAGDIVYTISSVDPNLVNANGYYVISLPTPVHGVTSMAMWGISASNKGLGVRDINVYGCKDNAWSQDYDGDGYPNRFDADSDNDGCPDATESNAVSTSVGYSFPQLDAYHMVDLTQFPIGTTSTSTTYGVPGSNRNNPVVGTYNPNLVSDECLACSPQSSLFTDVDQDGIADNCDLDNDNDGIHDTVECPNGGNFTEDPIIYLNLSNATELPDAVVGDYKGPSIYKNSAATLPDGTCVDVLIEVEQVTKSKPEYFIWNTSLTDGTVSHLGSSNTDYHFTVHYYACGTTNPVNISTIYTIRDIDGDCDFNQDFISDNPLCDQYTGQSANDDYVYVPTGSIQSYYFSDTTLMYPINSGLNTYFYSSGTDYGMFSGISTVPWSALGQKVFVKYKKTNTFSFNYWSGAFGGIFMDFSFNANILCDYDGDGYPNVIDNDSDNDGCPDAIEGSHLYTVSHLDTNGRFTGAVDANGVPIATNGVSQQIGDSQDSTQYSACFTLDTVIAPKPCNYTCPVTVCPTGDDLPTTVGSTSGACTPTPGYTSSVDSSTGCIVFTSLATATDTVWTCVYICDSNDNCDTTIVAIPPPDYRSEPDINAGFVNFPIQGDVSTNDEVLVGTTYGLPQAIPGNPDTSMPVMNPDGTYSFITDSMGVFNFLVPVCPPGATPPPPCPLELLTITVVKDSGQLENPPIANLDQASTLKNQPVKINVKSNDQSTNRGGALGNPILVSNPANGSAIPNADGTFTYIPNPGFTGIDTFTYEVCDTSLSPPKCAQALVIIDVIDSSQNSITASDDYNHTVGNIACFGNARENDVDPNGDHMTVTAVDTLTPILGGSYTIDTAGNYTFQPNGTFIGTTSFVYEICDELGACEKATVYITVGPDIGDLGLSIVTSQIFSSNCVIYAKWLVNEIEDVKQVMVQRAVNSFDFKDLGAMEFDALQSTEQWLTYMDAESFNENTTLYYRIRIEDYSGDVEYSSFLKMNTTCLGNSEFNAYPSPAKDVLNVDASNLKGDSYSIQIRNVLGQLVKTVKVNTVNGKIFTIVDVSAFSGGKYMISLVDQDGRQEAGQIVQILH